jgi:hypothetical protein
MMMMTMAMRLMCMAFVFSTLGSGVVVMARPQSTTPVDYSIQGNLTRARNVFHHFLFEDGSYGYAYGYQRSCRNCTEDFQGPNWVIVQGGTVTNVTRRTVEHTPIATSEYNNDTAQTIPDLFDRIQEAIDTQSDEITVIYNEEYGYPVTISIDYDLDVADEDFILTIDYFAPYQAWQEVRGPQFHHWQLLTETLPSLSYDFVFQRFCECSKNYSGPFQVTVQENIVTNVTRLFTLDDSNVTVDLSRSSSWPVLSLEELNIPTIDQLFDIIQEASTPFALRVTYDPIVLTTILGVLCACVAK